GESPGGTGARRAGGEVRRRNRAILDGALSSQCSEHPDEAARDRDERPRAQAVPASASRARVAGGGGAARQQQQLGARRRQDEERAADSRERSAPAN